MAEDFKTAQPLEFYKQFLKQNIRPDGRSLLDFRKTLLNVDSINTANGSALVRLGHTMVVCGIKAELAEPSPDHPNIGFFVPNVELPPACSPEFRPGPPGEKAQVLSQFIADTVKRKKELHKTLTLKISSNLIQLQDLCVKEKKEKRTSQDVDVKYQYSWVIYADLMCLSHDGNLTDALLLALYAALTKTTLPIVTYNEETDSIEIDAEKTTDLKLGNEPVSTTVALFDSSTLLVDPTYEEEQLSSGVITVVVGDQQQLCSVYKPGDCPVSESSLQECIQAALKRSEHIHKLLSELEETIDR